MVRIFDWNFEVEERCKGVHCVDLGESFPTSIYLQKSASLQPRTSLSKFGGKLNWIINSFFIRLLIHSRSGSSWTFLGSIDSQRRLERYPSKFDRSAMERKLALRKVGSSSLFREIASPASLQHLRIGVRCVVSSLKTTCGGGLRDAQPLCEPPMVEWHRVRPRNRPEQRG